MSKNKSSSQKPPNEKIVELERANQRIEELSKEKEHLKQLLIQYQKADNKNNFNEISTSIQNGGFIAPENLKSTGQFENLNQRTHTLGEYGSFTTLEKVGIQSNSTLHERIKPSQNYEQYSRKKNQNENDVQMILKTENVKDEVIRIGQNMDQLYKKIEGYERLQALDVMNRKKGHSQPKYKQRQSSKHSCHHHNYHHCSHSKSQKSSPKKQYQSSDSEDYHHAVHDYSSTSSCNRSVYSNSSQDDVGQNRDSFCSKCNNYSSVQKSQKNDHRNHEQHRCQHSREKKLERSNSNKKQKQIEKQPEDYELYQEALNLLKNIQHNPQTKVLFIQKFGSEEQFLETLKRSSKSKMLLLKILKLMVEILNSGQQDFSSQLYSQYGFSYNNQNTLPQRSLFNSQVIVSPLHHPKTSSSGFNMQSLNLGNQQIPQNQRQESQPQYTGDNLIKLLEQKAYNPISQNASQKQSSRRNSQVGSNNNQSQNQIPVQSNLQLNYLNGSFQNPFSIDQMPYSNNQFGQSKLGLLSFFPEKPKPQFQAELREVQNREALLKMQEYETEIETLEDKLKKIRSKVEDENRKKEQEEAERLRKQKEDFLRRQAEQEEAENLRKQALELERKRKEQEERDRLQREKDEYERRIKQLKDDEEKIKQEFERKRREQEEEDRRKQRENEEEQNRLRKQREEEDRRRQREYEEQQEILRRQREKDYEDEQNRLRKLREEDERQRKLREEDERQRKLREQEERRRRKLEEEEEERRRQESLNHDTNYKVVPDYMKVTKNRCNYVKDVQKEYLKRSSSVVSSASNTPKSNTANNAASLNPNWAKALSKFIDKDEQGSEEDASVLNEEPNSAKPKSKFAGDTPTRKGSLQVIKTNDTPKSASGFQQYKNNNTNFSSIIDRAQTDVK